MDKYCFILDDLICNKTIECDSCPIFMHYVCGMSEEEIEIAQKEYNL